MIGMKYYSRGGVGLLVGGGVIILPLTPLSTTVVCCACASTCGGDVTASVTAMVGTPVVGSFVVGLTVGSFVVCVELIEREEEVCCWYSTPCNL